MVVISEMTLHIYRHSCHGYYLIRMCLLSVAVVVFGVVGVDFSHFNHRTNIKQTLAQGILGKFFYSYLKENDIP